MFSNRALQVRMVRTSTDNQPPMESTQSVTLDPEVIKDLMTHTVITIGIAYSAAKVLNTLAELTIVVARAKLY